MQEDHRQEPLILREKLLEAVDADSNVRDVPLILEVLGKLECLPVTKEVLESTRLGKTVNDLRRKVKDAVLARRLKDLVKKWRDAVLVEPVPPQNQNHTGVNGASATSTEDGVGVIGGGPGPGGGSITVNRHLLSGYTSASSSPTFHGARVSPAGSFTNSLSPRIQIQLQGQGTTNYNTNLNNSNRNGSSSIANNRSPNTNANNHHHHHHKNLQLQPAALVSPSASSSSPHLGIQRNLISPHKSKSPGGPIIFGSSSNLSPLPTSHFQSAASSSYAPNAETVSRTNVANKRFREADDSPISTSEPPLKRSRGGGGGVNGTLDDPMLALDDISRDSYASRGSDHSDGFTKDHRFSSSTLSPATPGQTSTLSPQMPIPGTDSNAPSPLTSFSMQPELEVCTIATANTAPASSEPQPKKKRRRKQNEFYQDNEAILREKIAQAEAEKAAKALREREQKEKEQQQQQLLLSQQSFPEENLSSNEFVNKYLKSQNELRLQMERDAVDVLASSTPPPIEEKVPKEKHKKKSDPSQNSTSSDISFFPSETEILAKLPPIDPEILREFANFKYDVSNPSPQPPPEDITSSSSDPLKKETEGHQMQSLSTTTTTTTTTTPPEEKKPPKFIDWGDSDEEEEEVKPPPPQPPPPEESSLVQIKSEHVSSSHPPSPSALSSSPAIKMAVDGDGDGDDEIEIDSHSLEEVDENGGLSLSPFHRGKGHVVDEDELELYIRDKLPNLNGNYDKDGEFREWHETLTVESYKQEPLHILPYTIIDF